MMRPLLDREKWIFPSLQNRKGLRISPAEAVDTDIL